MQVGTMFFGEVEKIEGQLIKTKFLVIGLPLFPLQSYYVLSDFGNQINGYEIPLHTKSIIYGYIRSYLGILAFVCGIFCFFIPEIFRDMGIRTQPLLFTIPIIATWIYITFFMGALGTEESKYRKFMGKLTGVYADPEMIPHKPRSAVLNQLIQVWQQNDKTKNLGDWQTYLRENSTTDDILPLAYTIARYAGDAEIVEKLEGQVKQVLL